MNIATAEISARIAELREQLGPHDCVATLALRARTFDGGKRHFVRQCMVCGLQRGGPMGKAKASAILNGADAPEFDESLADEHSRHRLAMHAELAAFKQRLTELEDPELAEIKAAVAQQDADWRASLALARTRAEAALDKLIEELEPIAWQHRMRFIIQHLTEAHASAFADPDEPPVNRFKSEAELRQWLDAWLAEDFEVWPEVPGVHLTEGVRVQIDYIIRPKEHLVRAGFKAGPIGLEVKHLPIEHGFSSKASRFVWQAVSYTDCEFELPCPGTRLPRVLLFSNMSFDSERRMLRGIDPSPVSNDRAKWNALLELANHANVGVLEVSGTRERREGWRIKFASGTYFSRSRRECSVSDRNLFEKVRIGSF